MAILGSAQLPAETRIPSAASTAPVTKPVPRHSALVRVTHWITTFCFFALLLTGIEIVISHPRFYWGETGSVLTKPLFQLPIPSSRRLVPTGYGYVLPDQNGWSRALHFEAAWIAVLTGLLYAISGLLTGHFRKNLLPSNADFSWRALLTSFTKPLRFERPSEAEASSYNVLQRLTYLFVIVILFPLVIWSGWRCPSPLPPLFPGQLLFSVAASPLAQFTSLSLWLLCCSCLSTSRWFALRVSGTAQE